MHLNPTISWFNVQESHAVFSGRPGFRARHCLRMPRIGWKTMPNSYPVVYGGVKGVCKDMICLETSHEIST